MGYRVSFRVGLCAFLIAAAGSTSCAQDQEPLIVLAAHGVTDTCSADTGVEVARLAVDGSFDTGTIVFFALKNNLLTQPANTNNTNIEDSEIMLTDVDVRLTTPQDGSIAGGLDSAFTEFNVDLATISMAPQVVSYVPVELPADSIAQIGAGAPGGSSVTLIMEVEFHALRASNRFGGPGEIDARPFKFPIEVCSGCLRDCSTCDDVAGCEADTSPPVATCGFAQGVPFAPDSCMMGG